MVALVWLQGQLSGLSLPSDSISSKEKCVCPGKAAVVVAVPFHSVPSNHPLSSTEVSPVLVSPVVPWRTSTAVPCGGTVAIPVPGTRNRSRGERENHHHAAVLQGPTSPPQGSVCLFILSVWPKINTLI